jgi:hypothetical protein
MSIDLIFPLVFGILGIALIGVSRVLPAISPGRAPTAGMRKIDIRPILFWEGVGALAAALAVAIIGFEADIVRAVIVIAVTMIGCGLWGVAQAVRGGPIK